MFVPTISKAEPDDRETLLLLLGGQFAELGIALPGAKLAAGVEGVLDDSRRGTFLLARVDGLPVGVAYLSFQWSLEHGGPSAWLEELFVLQEQRSAGIGRALLRAALAHAAERGCAAVDLEVEEAHPRAARLYEREGFVAHRRNRWVKRLRLPSERR